MRLTKSRRKIDRIDEKIVGLLNKRARTTLEIKRRKISSKEDLYSPHREKEIYGNVKNQGWIDLCYFSSVSSSYSNSNG